MRALRSLSLSSLALALSAPLGACSSQKGALVLAISTDMQTPKDISTISVFITEGAVVKFDYVGVSAPDGTLTLPATLAIVEPDDPSTQVQIRVVGFNGQTARVLRDVQTTVPHEQTALLRVPLDFIDDGSGSGMLPDANYPTLTDGVPEGDSMFDPSVIASKCDPMLLCQMPGSPCQTMVDGVCASAVVTSSTLPAYAGSDVFGDGGLTPIGTPAVCFDVPTCFAAATPVATKEQGCSFPLPSGASPSTFNVALVTQSTGACLTPGQCYVPLPNDANEGWTLQSGAVQLAPGVCMKLGGGVTLAVSVGACPAETLSNPVCEPTGDDAGGFTQPVADSGVSEAEAPGAAEAGGSDRGGDAAP
jgi:hypothetical protein